MISPLPWKINVEKDDSGIIRDANDEIIAEDYTFKDLDDFEAIPRLINHGAKSGQLNEDIMINRDQIMQQWDFWRKRIAEGDNSSAPRDWFESILDLFESIGKSCVP